MSLNPRLVRTILAVLCSGIGLFDSAFAIAAPATPPPVSGAPLAIVPFSGSPKGDLAPAETATHNALAARTDLSVLGQKHVASALRGKHVSTTSAAGVQEAAKLLKVELLVTGQLKQQKLSLALWQGPTGKVLATTSFEDRAHKFPEIATSLVARWSAALTQATQPAAVPVAVPPPAEPVPVVVPVAAPVAAAAPLDAPPAAAASANTAKTEPTAPGPLFIDLALGAGVLGRNLSYHQDLFGTLVDYQLDGVPVFGGTLSVYPLAFSGSLLAYVGLIGEWERTASFTADFSGESVAGSSDFLAGGLRVRFPFGCSEMSVTGEYGRQYFRFGGQPGQATPVPNYDYDFLLAALDGRIVFGQFALLLGGGYLGVVQNGLANSGTFPHSQVAGITAHLGPAFLFTDNIELRLTGDYQRYFFSMESRPGDQYVAGGAVDQYLSIVLAVAFRIHS